MAHDAASEEASQPKARPWLRFRQRPVAFYLFALILVILIPALIMAGMLLLRTNDAQEEVVRALTNATVQSAGQSVDRELSGMITTLRVLSTSRALQEGDLADLYRRGRMALTGTGAYLIAVDAEMNQLLNTRVAFGEPLGKVSDTIAGEWALQHNAPAVSGLFFGQTSRTNVFNVWLPVSEAGDVRLLVLSQDANGLLPALQSRELPSGWNAAIVDADNQVIVGTPGSGLEIGDIMLLRQDPGLRGRDWATETVDGRDVITSEWRSNLSGWRVIAWADAAVVQRPLGESLLQLGAWGLVIALAAAGIAVIIAQRVGTSVLGLQKDARRLGNGELIYPRSYPVTEIAEISKALAEAGEQRQAAERDNRFLMRELAHRSKNQMAVIAAMAKQTARGATDINAYVQALERRIMGLARSTDLLLAHGRAGVTLRELIDQQLAPFRPADLTRMTIEGPGLRINPQGAQILGMALHELATNATRYGAFADPDGHMALTWSLNRDELHIRWRETLGRVLVDTDRAGFGTIVLRTMVGGALGAQVERLAHADGVEWNFRVPLTALDPAFAAVRPDEKD